MKPVVEPEVNGILNAITMMNTIVTGIMSDKM